jgi:uncharacterized OsmC-like protein
MRRKEIKMTVRENINLDTMESFRNYLKDNPEKGNLRLEAKAVYEGHAGQSVIHVGRFSVDEETVDQPNRQYAFPFGARKEIAEMIGMESARDDMEPVEMALASTAACLVHSITLNAARMGINTTGLEITVRTNLDPRVLLALKTPEEHGANMGAIELEVKVGKEVTDEEMEIIQKLCRYSPVHAMMSAAIEVKEHVSRSLPRLDTTLTSGPNRRDQEWRHVLQNRTVGRRKLR